MTTAELSQRLARIPGGARSYRPADFTRFVALI